MIVGLGRWELHLDECQSLKDKRRVLKSLKERTRQRFNVSIAETDHQDMWQRAEIACAVVTTDRSQADSVLRAVDDFVDRFGGVRVIDVTRELL